MKYRGFAVPALFLLSFYCMAQYPPPAGYEGTTAMFKDSVAFVGWASSCIDQRGYINLSDTTVIYAGSNRAQYGHYYYTTGKADGYAMSLGDGGIATLYFDTAISNGPGPDFAVFENSFSDDFLELAFVEVSSDGNRFVRFPSVSLTSETVQVPTFGTIDTRKINNLAGKYRGFFGTPFDLQDLADSSGIDLNNIIRVRVTDVVGCIENPYARYDSQGHKVNDPWPTSFDTGGFDLDAVGVIHNNLTSVEPVNESCRILIYPNPCSSLLNIKSNGKIPTGITLSDLSGRPLIQAGGGFHTILNTSSLQSGIYLLKIKYPDGFTVERKVIKTNP